MPTASDAHAQLVKMPKDEPVFILRAQDQLAPDIVREWANHAEAAGVNKNKVNGAREWAAFMDAWPTKQLPD